MRIVLLRARMAESPRARLRLTEVESSLREIAPDVVALFNVDRHYGGRSLYRDESWLLGTRLGMTTVFAPEVVLPAPDRERPLREHGSAVLARGELESWTTVPLPAWPGTERPHLLRTRLRDEEGVHGLWTANLSDNETKNAGRAEVFRIANVGEWTPDLVAVDAPDRAAAERLTAPSGHALPDGEPPSGPWLARRENITTIAKEVVIDSAGSTARVYDLSFSLSQPGQSDPNVLA